jgi:hypothetical protein
MLLTPPSLTLIFKQRLDNVCGEVLFTFLAWTHWVAMPNTVSPTRFTSAANSKNQVNAMFAIFVEKNITVDGCFAWEHNAHQLKALER